MNETIASPAGPAAPPIPSACDVPPPGPAVQRASGKYRVLFLHPGPVPPNADPRRNALFHLSRHCNGDIVTTRWRLPEDLRRPRRPVRFDSLGDFGYHATRNMMNGLVRAPWNFAYSLLMGLRLSLTGGRYDVIVSYGPYVLSLAGWILARLTGAKLVIEVPGPPTEGFVFDGGLLGRLKLRVARRLVPFLLRRADATRLYYAWQLDGLPGGGFPPAYVFPDFVPVSLIPSAPPAGAATATATATAGRYILCLGFPFRRKGVDVLIRAFLKIADRHPDVALRVIGHCPDLAPYRRLAGDHPRIRFQPGIPNEEAMRLLAGCSVFALPSRMEGVPRVLIEAMAAQRPVVSTRVSGIPALVEHGVNGLLCEMDDVDGLADCLERLLDDPEYARRLAVEGQRLVLRDLTEERFAERFREMLEELVGMPAARPV